MRVNPDAVVSRDQRPVLIKAERTGEAALIGAAAAWWGAIV